MSPEEVPDPVQPRSQELETEAHEGPPPRFSLDWDGGPGDDDSIELSDAPLVLRAAQLDKGGCQLTAYVSIDSDIMDSRETTVLPEQWLGADAPVQFEIEISGELANLKHAGALSAIADCCGYVEGASCERHAAPTLYVAGAGAAQGSVALAGESALVQDWNSGALDVDIVPGAEGMTRIVDLGDPQQDAVQLAVSVEVVP